MRRWVAAGEHVLRELGTRLDDLHEETATPLTARRTWLQTWVEAHPEWQPHAIGLEDPQGALAAVALLATRRVGPLDRVVLLGHGPSDVLSLPSRNARAAGALGEEVSAWLLARRDPWHLWLRNLRASDAAVHTVARSTKGRVREGDVSPVLRAEHGPDLSAYISGNHRRGVSRLRNRLAREGHSLEVRHLEGAAEVAAAQHEVERVLRARDVQLGRVSIVDQPPELSFLRDVVSRHAEAGQLRLTCAEVDGRLAAYVLCFLDGDVTRMWSCRFDPALARFAPGRIAMDASVAHALAQGAHVYDFMRGEERYKSSYATHHDVTLDLSASSHAPIRVAETLALRGRERVRSMEATGGRSADAAAQVRRLVQLSRRGR